MTVLYDNIGINQGMLLDLPFREGRGIITQDVAKPHHPVTLVNTPTWTALPSGLMTLNLNGTNEYLQCLNASCADLEFTTEDYTILVVINWATGDDSQIIMGRYAVDTGGWELYLYDDWHYYLTLRHHHAGGTALRSGCYSGGWAKNTNWLLGISRIGTTAFHYRNGVALPTIGSLEDPEATTSDLVIGVRFTKDRDNFKNMLWRPRVRLGALTAEQHMIAYEQIKRWL